LEIYPASQLGQEAEFTPDSSLEGDGFEPSVPRDMTNVSTVLLPVGRP
jgi:hypothetical protein